MRRARTVYFEVRLHVTNSILTRIDGLVLEGVPEEGDNELGRCGRMLNQSGDSGLRDLCRNLLGKVRHPEKIGIEKVAEWIQSGAKGDRELAIQGASVRGNRRPKGVQLLVR